MQMTFELHKVKCEQIAGMCNFMVVLFRRIYIFTKSGVMYVENSKSQFALNDTFSSSEGIQMVLN